MNNHINVLLAIYQIRGWWRWTNLTTSWMEDKWLKAHLSTADAVGPVAQSLSIQIHIHVHLRREEYHD